MVICFVGGKRHAVFQAFQRHLVQRMDQGFYFCDNLVWGVWRTSLKGLTPTHPSHVPLRSCARTDRLPAPFRTHSSVVMRSMAMDEMIFSRPFGHFQDHICGLHN